MRLLAMAIVAFAVGACGPRPAMQTYEPAATEASAANVPAATGCAGEAAVDWAPVRNGPAYRVAASASNPICAEGDARIAVTDASGNTLFSGAYAIAPMTTTVFADVASPDALKAALQQWIAPGQGADTTRELPDWPADAEQPQSGEFPFYPAEGMTRDAWLRLRAQDKPVFCFVQGGESMNCLVLDAAAGTLQSVGAQSFPG